MNPTPNLLPEMSEKFDMVLKQMMLAKREIGSSVKKDASNPFHKSRYATLGAHLELTEATLDKYGLILLQTVNGSHDKAVLVATLCHAESGQWIKSYLPLPNPKSDSQGLGAAITYMRRYSISSMLGLNAEDDDGETASGRGKHDDYKKEQKAVNQAPPMAAAKVTSISPNNPKIGPQQTANLKNIEARLSANYKTKLYDWMKKAYEVSSIENLTVDIYPKVLEAFTNASKLVEAPQQQRELAHA